MHQLAFLRQPPVSRALTLEFNIKDFVKKQFSQFVDTITAVLNAAVMPASLSIPILVVAVAVSIAVGVLAGIVPAFRAARLDPIDSLRYE